MPPIPNEKYEENTHRSTFNTCHQTTAIHLNQFFVNETFVVFVHVRSTAKIVFGASCYSCNNVLAARTEGSASELCADNDYGL